MLRQCHVAGPRGVCMVLVACRGATALPGVVVVVVVVVVVAALVLRIRDESSTKVDPPRECTRHCEYTTWKVHLVLDMFVKALIESFR